MMPCLPRSSALLGLLLAALSGCTGGECLDNRQYFEQEVWGRVMSRTCVKCHGPEGVAAERNAKLLLLSSAYPTFLDDNYANVVNVAKIQYDGTSELLLKPLGQFDHGGGPVLKKGSPEHDALIEMVRRIGSPVTCAASTGPQAGDRVTMLSPTATLQKASLDLVGRVPRAAEVERVAAGGEPALAEVLGELMREEAFTRRVQEIYNDLLLTNRYQGGILNLLLESDYPSLYWYNPMKLPGNMQTPEMQQKGAWSSLGVASEPLELIAHVVREDRPFGEILSAPYTMVTPYSARVYGLDPASLGFADVNSPYEFREAKVAIRRDGKDLPLPHAGLLTQPVFLLRYPTTATNLNRHRARMTLKHFLATDILKAAERPIDPSSVTSLNPTRDDKYCNVCHKVIDPIAGTYQKWDGGGRFQPTGAWPTAMPQPGLGSKVLDDVAGYPTALGWLARELSADPRFAVATVQTVYRGLAGRELLVYPPDDAPDFTTRIEAWRLQQSIVREVVAKFQASGQNLKAVFQAILISPLYRATGVAAASPGVIEGLGTGRLLTPELLDRKIAAVTGMRWVRGDRAGWLVTDYNLLYGGIDSNAVTERLGEPNGIIVGVGLRMANEVACRATAWDFSRPKGERRLFPEIEITTRPEDAKGNALPSVAELRTAVRRLHRVLLGEDLPEGDPEIERTYQLFVKTWRELAQAKSSTLAYDCQARVDRATFENLPANRIIDKDVDFTIRSWMAVMTYLLSDWKFLYQ